METLHGVSYQRISVNKSITLCDPLPAPPTKHWKQTAFGHQLLIISKELNRKRESTVCSKQHRKEPQTSTDVTWRNRMLGCDDLASWSWNVGKTKTWHNKGAQIPSKTKKKGKRKAPLNKYPHSLLILQLQLKMVFPRCKNKQKNYQKEPSTNTAIPSGS